MKILSLDDHPLFSSGLKASLSSSHHSFDVLTIGQDNEALDYLSKADDVDLLILDLSMPDMDGISFMRALINRDIYIPVVIMSASEDIQKLQEAFELGALGYLPKSLPPEQLVDAILTVLNGETYIPEKIASALANITKYAEENTQTILSNRQLEILKMVQAGLTNQGIAAVLYISETTVKSHLQNIFRILSAKNRVDCVRKAEHLNILPKVN